MTFLEKAEAFYIIFKNLFYCGVALYSSLMQENFMILPSLFWKSLLIMGFCVNKKCDSAQLLYTFILRKCIKTVVHLGIHCSVV